MKKYLYTLKLLEFIEFNKEFFLEKVVPFTDSFEYFIAAIAPQKIAGAYGDEYTGPLPIKNIIADLKESTANTILFVEFADEYVVEPTDTYAIAISIDPNNNIRLFTYEKGESYLTKEEMYFVGEFDKNGKHSNYGTTEALDLYAFGDKVIAILKS